MPQFDFIEGDSPEFDFQPLEETVAYGIRAPMEAMNTLQNLIGYGAVASSEGQKLAAMQEINIPPTTMQEVARQGAMGQESIGIRPLTIPSNVIQPMTFGENLLFQARQIPGIGPLFESTKLPYQIEEERLGPEPPTNVREAIQQGSRNVVAPMLTPEGIVTLGAAIVAPELVALKAPRVAEAIRKGVSGYFGYEGAKGFIESAPEALAPGAPLPIRVQKGIEALGSGAIAYGAGRHLIEGRPPTSLPVERTRYATQERIQPEGRQPEYPGTQEIGLTAEAGRGDRPLSTAGLEKETQVLLNPIEVAYIDAASQNIKDPIVFTESSGLRGAEIASIDRDGNIVISRPGFQNWIKTIPERRRQEAVNSILQEESNHLRVMELFSEKQRAEFWNNMTAAERALYLKMYTGKWTRKGALDKYGEELSDVQLGWEAMNYFQMELLRMNPREIAEAVGARRLGLQTLRFFAKTIFETRKALGREASVAQARMLKELQDKANIGIVAAGGQPVTEETEGEMPFSRARKAPEEKRRPYGFWIDPMGGRVPVVEDFSHTEVGAEILKKLDPNYASSKASYREMQEKGFSRAVFDGKDLYIEVPYGNVPTAVQSAAKNIALDWDVNVWGEMPNGNRVKIYQRPSAMEQGELPFSLARKRQEAKSVNPLVRARKLSPTDFDAMISTAKEKNAPAQLIQYLENVRDVHRLESKILEIEQRHESNINEARRKDFQQRIFGYHENMRVAEEALKKETQPLFDLRSDVLSRFEEEGPGVLRDVEDVASALENNSALGYEPFKEGTRWANELTSRIKSPYVDEYGNEITPGSENPYSLSRYKAQDVDERIAKLRTASPEEFAAETPPERGGITGDAWNMGVSLTDRKQLDTILEARNEASVKMRDLMKSGRMKEAMAKGYESQYWREMYEAATGTGSAWYALKNEPGYKPPFPQPETTRSLARQPELGLEEIKPGEVRAIAPLPTANQIGQVADTYFSDAAQRNVAPSFEDFRGQLVSRFGSGISREGIYYTWQDAIVKKLMSASGKEIDDILDSMRLRKDVARALKPGEADPTLGHGKIPDKMDMPAVQMELGEIAKAFQKRKWRTAEAWRKKFGPAQRTRYAAIGAIMDKLTAQAGEAPKKSWSRTDVGPEDVAQRYTVVEASKVIEGEEGAQEITAPEIISKPSFNIIPQSIRNDPKLLGELVTRNAAVDATGKQAPPRTVSKNIVALKDQLGRIIMVSTWKDPRYGAKVTNPEVPTASGKVIDQTLLKQWTPIAVATLRDPVKGFAKRFANQAEFDSYWGDLAIEGTPGIKTSSFTGPEAGIAEAAAGLSKPSRAPEPVELAPSEMAPQLAAPTAVELTTPGRPPIREQTPLYRMPRPQPEPLPAGPLPEAPGTYWNRIPDEVAAPPSVFTEPAYGKPTGRIFTSTVRPGRTAPTPAGPGAPLRVGIAGSVTGRRTPHSLARQVIDNSAKVVDKTLVEGLRWYSEWMVDRLNRAAADGTKPKTAALADAANIIIGQERELYGSLTDVLDKARRLAGRPGRATTWLHGRQLVTPEAGISNVVEALEGSLPVPAFARELVAEGDAANFRIGQIYQLADPNFVPSHKFQRNPTGFGYDLIREGAGEAWEKWVFGQAQANNMPLNMAVDFFHKWKKVLDDPRVDEAAIESVNQDFKRSFPKAITEIYHAGQWQKVLHSDLFNYLESAARMATHKVAFRQMFPATPAGRRAFTKLMEDVRTELGPGFQQDIVSLMRALQGHPTDSYNNMRVFRPGQPIGEAFRFLNTTVGNLFAKQVLTGQMIVQPGEVFSGSTPVFLGYRNYVEGLARARQLYPQMELQGAVNRVILDFSFDPNSPVRSTFRIAGNTLSKAFAEQWLNEVQEAAAAATAKVVSERISAGTLSSWERSMLPQTFRAMGFNRGQIPAIMAGDPGLLALFESRAASFLTSGNKSIAEGSPLGANRFFNSVFRFQSYPMMKTNQLRKVWGNVFEAIQKGDAKERINSVRMLGRFFFGNATQGAMTAALASLAYQGLAGAGIKSNEIKDEPFMFLLDSALASMSGPLYMIWNGGRDKGFAGIGEAAARMIFPYQIMKELWNFAGGTGSYRDLDLFDRIGKYAQMKIPGSRLISQGLAITGLSQDNKELDAAIQGLYRWRRAELGIAGTPPLYRDDTRKAFRTAMKKAVEALKDGRDEDYEQALDEAYEAAEADTQVKQSLAAKTLLKGIDNKKLSDEEMEALRKRIGNRAVDLLEEYDAMIEAAARAE